MTMGTSPMVSWRFSLALYARPGVAQALIVLQEAHGFDINMILLALWAGAVLGVRVQEADFAHASAASARLRHLLIEPLRRLRRELKQASDDSCVQAVRQRILSIELRGEREVQARIVAVLSPRPKLGSAAEREARARANLAAYLGEAGMAEVRTVLDALRSLMRYA